jgi:hypothetical protein
LWILLDKSSSIKPNVAELVASWFALPASAFIAIWVLVKLIRRTPSVVLDREGVHDTASIVSSGLIPWRDIASAQVFSVGKKKSVGILLKDNEAFIAKRSAPRRALARLNIATGTPLIAIPESTISVRADVLVANILAWLAAHES